MQRKLTNTIRDVEGMTSNLGWREHQSVTDRELRSLNSLNPLHEPQLRVERSASKLLDATVPKFNTDHPHNFTEAEARLKVRPRTSSGDKTEVHENKSSEQVI